MTAARTGLTRAEANRDDWWWSPAMAAVEHLAAMRRPFTAYDVTLLGVVDPDHPSRWGALFSAASRMKLIETCGYQQSSRPSAGGLCRVWCGRPPGSP